MLNLSKEWYIMLLVVIGGVSAIIGLATHIDTLQFQEIATANDKIHDLELHAAVINARVGFLADLVRDLRTQHFSENSNDSNLSIGNAPSTTI